MKNLMTTNIYDISEALVIVGSCLPNMQPSGFEKLKEISKDILEVCLEETHINMVITKVGGMIRTGKIKKLVFATVDKSPHCIQMHYIQDELKKMMNLDGIQIENYVIVNNTLEKINPEIISISKNLTKVKELLNQQRKADS